MLKFLVTLVGLVTMSCFSATEVPTPVDKPTAPKVLVEVPQETLTQDEIKYLKTAFRSQVINDCLNILIAAETDKNSGALTRITHPMTNPLAQLVTVRLFKDGDSFDKELFAAVYKDADARNKVRVWDIQGEVKFLRDKIEAKIKDDPLFADELLAAYKAMQKGK